jgi:hypothetical protein
MIRDIVGASGGFLWWGVTARRDGWMQPTPLRAHKIGAFLKVSIGSEPIPIYRCAAADAKVVSLLSLMEGS